MLYDAAIIGAGAEGLVAATLLSQSGLRVLVIERSGRAGGRSVTREFHPGYRAPPFADQLAQISVSLFWALDLARHGAVFAPERASLALWPDRRHTLAQAGRDGAEPARLLAEAARQRALIAQSVMRDAGAQPAESLFRRKPPLLEHWSAMPWAAQSLDDVAAAYCADADTLAHVAAQALCGRAADPFLPGSALYLLGAGSALGRLPGGLSRFGEVLAAAAQTAGAEFMLGVEASDILRRDGRVTGVGLADGNEVSTPNVISSLDLKRTFLTFFPWNSLPKGVIRRVHAFRMAGSTARVLFALSNRPDLPDDDGRTGPIHVAPSLGRLSEAYHAWRTGVLSDSVPVTLRLLSDSDPSLAPAGAAVVTATLGAVPFRLFDGPWTHEKRERLRALALAAAETAAPGFAAKVLAAEVVVPPDIEDALGVTEGDLGGGEIAADQMLGVSPWGRPAMPRCPVPGLYLAGSSLSAGAFATGLAGAAAAHAVIADKVRAKSK